MNPPKEKTNVICKREDGQEFIGRMDRLINMRSPEGGQWMAEICDVHELIWFRLSGSKWVVTLAPVSWRPLEVAGE